MRHKLRRAHPAGSGILVVHRGACSGPGVSPQRNGRVLRSYGCYRIYGKSVNPAAAGFGRFIRLNNFRAARLGGGGNEMIE
ncbi:MAG TPA: hypothetical protein VFT88_05090 [Acidobacteriaceae bacterium]|nr:hypothetical protein [Acidobacteriaceae bacterium]